jgi:raffinose/stachyose/melibiose transport system substrate-binding protein
MYQAKIEIDEALKAACDEYTRLYPNVTFAIETTSENYVTTLKTKFAGGQKPDIFQTNGDEDLIVWREYIEDLSDQEWANDIIEPARRSGVVDGKVLGFPLAVEGFGYVYHKDIFAAAGIGVLPQTLSELEDVCKRLEAYGISPISENYAEWFQPGMFMFTMALARQDNPDSFIESLNRGSRSMIGNKEFLDLAKWITVDVRYSKSPLNTDFNTQTSDFATKKTAMMLGGSWSQPSLDAVDPNMDVGLFPIPIGDDAVQNDKMYVSCAPFWHIYNQSEVKDEAKKFLAWLAVTEEGRHHLSTGFKLIPGFSSIKIDPAAIGRLGVDMKAYIDANKTYGIYNSRYPNGMGDAQRFGESITKYAAGQSTTERLIEELQQQWK